ncbi:MAG: heparin lyase I family protein [Verrucomicrobia bacterium]|nr:heparin lyase I family protein [Leptolyngbya sp. ES-bin-22]
MKYSILQACLWLLALLNLTPVVSGCSPLNSIAATENVDPSPSLESHDLSTASARSVAAKRLWSGDLSGFDWRSQWYLLKQSSWGWENVTIIDDPEFSHVLRVRYPAGSASPTVHRETGAPLGGAQFYASLNLPPQDSLRLSYYVRFSEGFDFVKGGKLPGLFGGTATSGGDNPDGANGFSTRFMWRREGQGEVYAYLPNSTNYGTSIGRGNWHFIPGTWHHLEQQVDLNHPEKGDGRVQVWLDGKKVLDQSRLQFRTTETLKIEGIFFSTFFGGNDSSWATPKDITVDFANFSVEQ